MIDAQILKKTYLFESLTDSELKLILNEVKEHDVLGGDPIFDEGAEAQSLYIIKHGSVEVLKKANSGEDHEVSVLSSGAHFGEMAYIDRLPRGASVVCKEASKILEIKYSVLDGLIQKNPDLGLRIYKSIAITLCKRVRQTSLNLSSLKDLKLKSI